MTCIRQSVIGVVIFSHFFLHDPADAKNVIHWVNIDGQCTCISNEPEISDFDEI